ncbi:hypothetical protein M1349_05900 [Patescibacteria group bacterium]|nr:hypothetical protein [Patescibacteria group bacterium]
MSKMYHGMASREKLATATLLENGYQMAPIRAEWLVEEGKLRLTDEEGKIRVLNETQISLCYKKNKEGKDVFDSLGHFKAFSDWIEQDERLIIFKILALEACGFGGVPQEDDPFVKDLEQRLSNPDKALQRGKEKIINLFNLKVNEEDPAKNDVFAETVLDVLFSSYYPLDED